MMGAMGLRDLGKRLRATVEELDDERLHDRFAGLGLTPIGEARRAARRCGSAARSNGC